MPNPKVPKTYVRPDNTAVLTCSHCGIQKVILADSFKGHRHKLKVKCVCQNVFLVNLEFRSRVRKKTHLRGTYINHSQDDSSGILFVENISVTGLAFTRADVEKFQVGDELTVQFTLDDEHNTEVRKEVIVRDVRQNSIGCEFEKSEDTFGSPLGYYIISK
jgi:hypothetical protein